MFKCFFILIQICIRYLYTEISGNLKNYFLFHMWKRNIISKNIILKKKKFNWIFYVRRTHKGINECNYKHYICIYNVYSYIFRSSDTQRNKWIYFIIYSFVRPTDKKYSIKFLLLSSIWDWIILYKYTNQAILFCINSVKD